jgi:putative transposase
MYATNRRSGVVAWDRRIVRVVKEAVMMNQDVQKRYKTDLFDSEWELIEPFLRQHGPGPRRIVSTREVVNALLYLDYTGCQWEMLPKEFPKYHTVNYYHLIWSRNGTWTIVLDALRQVARNLEGHADEPTAAILDSQSVKTTGKGEERGYDAGKKIKGRKRFLVVDTLGFILGIMVVSAGWSESTGGSELLEEINTNSPSITKIWADSGYQGKLVDYATTWYHFILEIVRPNPDQRGFMVQKKRWIVERTLSWFTWWRRLSKDYETTTTSSEGMIRILPPQSREGSLGRSYP